MVYRSNQKGDYEYILKWITNWITVSSTVFLIFAPASVTVLPALLTAEAKKLPIVRAPCMVFLETSSNPEEIATEF